MNASTLLANLGLSYAALAALCLSMRRHHGAALDAEPGPRRALLLRILGWMGVALSLTLAVRLEGWTFGPVQWIGSLTGAALLLVGLLSYRPRYLLPTVLAALPLAALATVSID